MLLAAEEKGARSPSLLRSCLCPGDQSLLVLLRDTGRSMCFLGRNATHSIHNNNSNNKSTQCPFPSNTGNERNAIFLLRHPSLPSSKCHARSRPPALCATVWAGALAPSAPWAPTAATHRCPSLLFAPHLWGNCWSQPVQVQIVQALPPISLYPGKWLLVSVSLKCRAIKLLLYLAPVQFSDVS